MKAIHPQGFTVVAGALLGLLLTNSANAYSYLGNNYSIITGLNHYNPSGPAHYEAEFNWTEAKLDAESRGGHLATFGSKAEWDAVVAGLGLDGSPNYWLGGVQPEGSAEPIGGWSWIDGTAWTFDAWASGEPNDCCWSWLDNQENYLMTWGDGSVWNDTSHGSEHWLNRGYILEIDGAAGSGGSTGLPEPASLGLFMLGLIGAGLSRRRSQ